MKARVVEKNERIDDDTEILKLAILTKKNKQKQSQEYSYFLFVPGTVASKQLFSHVPESSCFECLSFAAEDFGHSLTILYSN